MSAASLWAGRGARRVAAGWALFLAVVLVILTAAVNSRLLGVTDQGGLVVAQAPGGTALDAAMVAISLLGSVEVTGVVVLLLVAIPVLRRRRFAPGDLALLAILVALTAVEVAGKVWIHQPLPPASALRGPRVGVGLSTPYSFPSGHMVRATLVYGLAALRLLRQTGRIYWLWLGVVLVGAIGYSRVYLGQHWPTDVVGGILLGGAALGLSLASAPGGSLGQD